MYRYINSQKKDSHASNPTFKEEKWQWLAESEVEQADELNGQFTDGFNKTVHTYVPHPNRSAPFMEDIHVSAEGVTKLLKCLNPSKSLGPDELQES